MPLSLYCIPVLYAEDSKFPNHFAIPQYERLNFQTAYLNFCFFFHEMHGLIHLLLRFTSN